MSDLVEFLRTRLDEDEQVALAAHKRPTPWRAAGHEADSWIVIDADGEPLVYDEGTPSLLEARHIAHHDPARALREVEAKRQIISEYERYAAERRRAMNGWDSSEPSPIIAALASVYADHPDYREEWKPEISGDL